MPHDRPPDSTSGLPDTPGDAARLTDGVRRGDRAAFSLLYERFSGRVFDVARSLTGRDEQFCLDVVQETMMRAIRSLPSLDSDAALGAWLTTTARRVAIDLLRSEWRRDVREKRRQAHAGTHSRLGGSDRTPRDQEELAWLCEQLRSLDADTELWLRRHVGDGASLRLLDQASTSEQGAVRVASHDAIYGSVRRALTALRRAAKEAFGDE